MGMMLNKCLMERISLDLTEKQVKSFKRMARIAYGVLVGGITATTNVDGVFIDFSKILMNNSAYSSKVLQDLEEFCLNLGIDFSLDDLYTQE